jgi:hypothetical protein
VLATPDRRLPHQPFGRAAELVPAAVRFRATTNPTDVAPDASEHTQKR